MISFYSSQRAFFRAESVIGILLVPAYLRMHNSATSALQVDAKKAVANALRNRWRRHQIPSPLKVELYLPRIYRKHPC